MSTATQKCRDGGTAQRREAGRGRDWSGRTSEDVECGGRFEFEGPGD